MDALQIAGFIDRHGETVTVSRAGVSPDATVKAKIIRGVPETFAGDKHVARHKLTIAAGDSGWGSWPVPPRGGDVVAFDGRDHTIDGAKSAKVGEDGALYHVTVIG